MSSLGCRRSSAASRRHEDSDFGLVFAQWTAIERRRRNTGNTRSSDATVEFTTNELTATCPLTGQPNFYELKLIYRPRETLIESKSLKLYLWGFRDKGIFAEDLAVTLLKDLVAACDPVEMAVDLTQQVRGGLQIRTVVRHPSGG